MGSVEAPDAIQMTKEWEDEEKPKPPQVAVSPSGDLGQNVHLKKVKPYPNPSWLSLALFQYVAQLIGHGFKENKEGRGLEHTDLWELHPNFQGENVRQNINTLWAEEKLKPKPSLGRAILKLTWHHILYSAMFEVVRLVGSFSGPILLRQIIMWIQDDNRDPNMGYIFAIGMALGSTAVAFGKSHSFHQALCVGLTVKACFNTLVYQKALVLSNAARQKRTTGEIINLMSTDAENMFQAFMASNSWWSVPLQLIISLYLIFQEVKNATWVGLGGLLFTFILLGFISAFMSKFQVARMKAADQRIRLLNEMMQAMKVIKLMAWETAILGTVKKTREEELIHVYRYSVTRACMIATVMGSTLVTALATFAAFVSMYPDLGMDPASIFTALALLNMLRFPRMQLPQGIDSAVKVNTSFGRLRRLLEADEADNITETIVPAPPAGQTILKITQGKFAWELEKTPEDLIEEAALKAKEKETAAKKEAAERKKKGKDYVEENKVEEEPEKPYTWAPALTGIS
ncbi:ABC transporter type 1, transmembrane domain-containing protein [Baffinella frigidus]|nr:ABC transporter type 1, transmembrane domain-containing protein [Cryptophyta sp. CCMP2293]